LRRIDMQALKKVAATLAMLGALTLGAIADTWADVPEGIEAGTEALAVACVMDDGLHGALKATKVSVPRPAYSKPAHYSAPAGMSEAEAKEWIAQRESGGDYSAVSSNGQWYGRYQLDKRYLDGDYSAAHQEEVADKYVKERYGSWSKAQEWWASHGWY